MKRLLLFELQEIWIGLGAGVGFCGEVQRRMLWKTSSLGCMRCGYGWLVSNTRNSRDLFMNIDIVTI